MPLHIFHLDRTGPVGYDEYSAFVVIAATEDEARHMCAQSPGDEGEAVWLSDITSTCISIGEADSSHERAIVLSSFEAG